MITSVTDKSGKDSVSPFTRRGRILFINFLTFLELLPLAFFTLARQQYLFYIPAFIMIVTYWMFHTYSAGGRYILLESPRAKVYLYRGTPLMYGAIFAASFLSEGWWDLIAIAVLTISILFTRKLHSRLS